jgi:hypothetical protein
MLRVFALHGLALVAYGRSCNTHGRQNALRSLAGKSRGRSSSVSALEFSIEMPLHVLYNFRNCNEPNDHLPFAISLYY